MVHPFGFTPALIAGLAFAAPALAGIPGDGTVDTTLCWSGPVQSISPTPSDRFGNYLVAGAVRTAQPRAMDAMRVECLGSFESHAADFRHKGYCVYRDASGDAIYGSDATSPDAGYTWEILGGTGKFEGMTGAGMVERVASAERAAPGTMAGCRRLVGKYVVYPMP
jgi:hypothetical protein